MTTSYTLLHLVLLSGTLPIINSFALTLSYSRENNTGILECLGNTLHQNTSLLRLTRGEPAEEVKI